MRILMGKKIRQRLATIEGRRELGQEVNKRIQQHRLKVLVDGEVVSPKKERTEA